MKKYNIETAKTIAFRPEKDDMLEFIKKDTFFVLLLYAFGFIAAGLSAYAYFYNSVYISVFVWTSLILYIAVIVGIFISYEFFDKKEIIIKNEKNQNYLLNLGYEVKKFEGDAVKSSKAEGNKIRPMLVNAETTKRHFLCMATIGAGKTVLMKGLVEQYLVLGGGCLIIDGKGTQEFANDMYGLMASVGREDDFVHLNFLDMDNTHTINPLLSGSALSIFEVLIALLAGEENEWKNKQREFMKNILKIMVYKRDNEKDFVFDFSTLTKMMDIISLTKVAIDYKHLAYDNESIENFVNFIASSIAMPFKDFVEGNKDDKKWLDEVMKAAQNDKLQGVYDASMSASAWRGIITTLASDYGKVFNSPNPDISLWEATQRNKVIFITLPTMEGETTPKDLGRLILGLIKGVAAQKAAKADEPTIPFVCFLDELGSYITDGFGILESKSRSLGISIFPFFQSPAQIDVFAKNDYERRQIIDVTGVHIIMKTLHPDTTEFYVKMTPKINVLKKNYNERRESAKGQGSTEDGYSVEEKDAITHDEVMNMSNGEMVIFANGRMHRVIAQAETTLLSEGKKTTYVGEKIPLTQYVSKREFFTRVNKMLENENLKQNFSFSIKTQKAV